MSHKLLLADDSATIQRVIELTFSGEDVNVLAVGDGEQAIARIPTEHPDIVLADIGMPKRSGYDVAAFVKSNPELKHIPVLLLAGAFEPVDEARAEQVGCDGVLVKPFEPQQVIARVRELLDGAKGSPVQATASVPRPVERLSGPPPRTLPFPKREEPEPPAAAAASEPVDAPAFSEPPSASVQSAPPAAPPVETSLDDYFDRLDAAFATLDSAPPSGGSEAGGSKVSNPVDVPTLDGLLGSDFTTTSAPAIDLPLPASMSAPLSPAPSPTPPPLEPPDVTPTRAPQATEAFLESTPGRNIVADAFTALLAVEQGEPGAAPVRFSSGPPVVTDALIDELTQRIAERLAHDTLRQIVADVVSDVAERLVREEIERIRGQR
jgi:CheY-like chemotaxis protein